MSSQKTPNLNLHKWVLSDPIKMGEFNENFAKIDAAVNQVFRVGDIRLSRRSSLGPDYLVANGTYVNQSEYPDVLPYCSHTTPTSGIVEKSVAKEGYIYQISNHFVILNGSSFLYRSATDINDSWHSKTISSNFSAAFIAEGGGYIVAISSDGTVAWATSLTGSWTVNSTKAVAFSSVDGVCDLAYFKGSFVILGRNGKSYATTNPSANASWSTQVFVGGGDPNYNGGGRLYVFDDVLVSTKYNSYGNTFSYYKTNTLSSADTEHKVTLTSRNFYASPWLQKLDSKYIIRGSYQNVPKIIVADSLESLASGRVYTVHNDSNYSDPSDIVKVDNAYYCFVYKRNTFNTSASTILLRSYNLESNNWTAVTTFSACAGKDICSAGGILLLSLTKYLSSGSSSIVKEGIDGYKLPAVSVSNATAFIRAKE
jgi:hypothetical protein